MKKLLSNMMVCLLLAGISTTGQGQDRTTGSADSLSGEYRSLFNGQNLDGWDVVVDSKGNDPDLFTVENGLIHVYANQPDRSLQSFGGIITKEAYSRYILQLEYKWGTKKFQPRVDFVRDAGIIYHMHGNPVVWPNGVECQIQEGDTGDLWAIGTQVSSTVQNVIRNYSEQGDTVTRGNRDNRFQRFHRAYCWEVPGWNKVELQVNGGHARYFVNGHLVNEAFDIKSWDETTETWVPLNAGKILLQAEGAEIFYRNIVLVPLN